MTEAILVAGLVAALREGLPGSVVFKHADRTTAGIPDISVTWRYTTVWLEVKLVAPDLYNRELQDLMMQRLARTSHAYYVVYQDNPHSTKLLVPGPGYETPEVFWAGWSHDSVVQYLRERWLIST